MKRFKIRKLFNEKDRKYLPEQHTFLVCAYKESPYLEQCIKSLLAQTKKSNIIISTSTPCNYIQEIAKKYNIEVLINIEKKGNCRGVEFWLSPGSHTFSEFGTEL